MAERSQIDYFLKLGKSIREIGRLLKRAASSISDEAKINLVNGKYDAKKAHHKSCLSFHPMSLYNHKYICQV